MFPRPNRIAPSVPIDATILPTNFSDLRYYWDCPKDYLLRRLMGFSPGVNESYGYGQQIHNLLALLHETLPNSNVIERLNREIRRRTRVVGSFPDGNSALMLVCARLRHVAGTQWGNKKYMNMKHLEDALEDTFIAG